MVVIGKQSSLMARRCRLFGQVNLINLWPHRWSKLTVSGSQSRFRAELVDGTRGAHSNVTFVGDTSFTVLSPPGVGRNRDHRLGGESRRDDVGALATLARGDDYSPGLAGGWRGGDRERHRFGDQRVPHPSPGR